MKTYLLLFCFFLLYNTVSAQKGATSAQDSADLMNILKKETEAFANLDFETWKSYWYRTENAYFTYTDRSGVFSQNGWAAIEKAFKEAFEGGKKSDTNFRRENVKIERQDQLAYITFDQYDKLNAENVETHKEESRVMIKTDGGWKILSAQVINLTSFDRQNKQLHHILLASFKPEAKPADIQYIFDKFNSIVGKVEGMKSCTMLKNADSASPFQYTFIMVFDSEEALAKYDAHENHKAAVERWMVVGDKVTVVDSWR